MEHENSDIDSDVDDTKDRVTDENIVEPSVDSSDYSEPDWRQFAATIKGFQLNTTQESLTSNLFTAVKAEKEYVLEVSAEVIK